VARSDSRQKFDVCLSSPVIESESEGEQQRNHRSAVCVQRHATNDTQKQTGTLCAARRASQHSLHFTLLPSPRTASAFRRPHSKPPQHSPKLRSQSGPPSEPKARSRAELGPDTSASNRQIRPRAAGSRDLNRAELTRLNRTTSGDERNSETFAATARPLNSAQSSDSPRMFSLPIVSGLSSRAATKSRKRGRATEGRTVSGASVREGSLLKRLEWVTRH
jgi:hypothetical protein